MNEVFVAAESAAQIFHVVPDPVSSECMTFAFFRFFSADGSFIGTSKCFKRHFLEHDLCEKAHTLTGSLAGPLQCGTGFSVNWTERLVQFFCCHVSGTTVSCHEIS